MAVYYLGMFASIFITRIRNEASHLYYLQKKDTWPVSKVQHEFQGIVESIVTVAGAFSCAQSFTMTMAIQ